jgi:DNA-binding transcriptional LysR family regulator
MQGQLELKHLRCLVAIVDTGSFTDAAIELGVSQAAVSRTLLALEEILGVRLLHRTSRSVTATTAGVQVLARARRLLADADDLVRDAATGQNTWLRIGHAWGAMGRHTAEFQRRWHERYPGDRTAPDQAQLADRGSGGGRVRSGRRAHGGG